MQKVIVITILMNAIIGCSSEKTRVQMQLPRRLKKVYEISKQTSYALLDADTAVNEIRLWELPGRFTHATAFFLKDKTISTQWYYLSHRNTSAIKVVGIASGQERIVDEIAERKDSIFFTKGGPALTCRQGVDTAIDSLLKLGFADMQSQPEQEDYRVTDGTAYIIEVRRGSFYKYVYYHNPELFANEPAQHFIKVYKFLTQERWRNTAFKSEL